jgi:hypothetical protein
MMDEFKAVQQRHHLPMGDFPHLGRFRELLARFNIAEDFPKLDKRVQGLLDGMQTALAVGINTRLYLW